MTNIVATSRIPIWTGKADGGRAGSPPLVSLSLLLWLMYTLDKLAYCYVSFHLFHFLATYLIPLSQGASLGILRMQPWQGSGVVMKECKEGKRSLSICYPCVMFLFIHTFEKISNRKCFGFQNIL